MHIGNRIAIIRKRNGMSQKEVSQFIVSRSHYCNIESGRYVPHDEILALISEKLKVPQYYLINFDLSDDKLSELSDILYRQIENLDLCKANKSIKYIQDNYPYIPSIKQELYFYILKCYYFIKLMDYNNATLLYNTFLIKIESIDKLLKREKKEVYYYVSGMINYYNKNYHNSFKYYKIGFKFLKKDKDQMKRAKYLYNISLVLHQLDDRFNAVYYAKEALNIYKAQKMRDKAADTHILLGILRWELKDIDNAKYHLLEAQYLINIPDLKREGKIYHNLGLVYKEENNISLCLINLYKSLEIKKKTNSSTCFITYYSLLDTYLNVNELEKVEKLYAKAKKSVKNKTDEVDLIAIRAMFLLKTEEFESYEKLIKKVIKYYKNNHMWFNLERVLNKHIKYLESKRKYKPAYQYSLLAMEAKDKIKQILNSGGEQSV